MNAVLPLNAQVDLTVTGRFKDGVPLSTDGFIRTINPGMARAGHDADVIDAVTGAGAFLPAGSMAQDTDVSILRLLASPGSDATVRDAAAQTQRLTRLGAVYEFDPQDAQFAAPATLTLPYDPSALNGADPRSLRLAYWNATSNSWQLLASSVDSTRRQVSAQTLHFSLYAVVESDDDRDRPPPAAPPAAVQIACNPIKPNCQPLRFQGLPPNARLRVHTIMGALVKDTSADGLGQAAWDGTNQGGARVASGVYVVFVQGGGTTKTFKVMVLR